jgi:hypothetical protein
LFEATVSRDKLVLGDVNEPRLRELAVLQRELTVVTPFLEERDKLR